MNKREQYLTIRDLNPEEIEKKYQELINSEGYRTYKPHTYALIAECKNQYKIKTKNELK